jgi:hypothetical protein
MTQETPDRLTALATLYAQMSLLAGYPHPLTDEEWLRRFDAHIKARSDYKDGSYSEGDKEAMLFYRDYADFKDAPEAAADEEMSNWDPGEFDAVKEQPE